MSPTRVSIGVEHRPGVGSRPTLGGRGVGPWLDEKSARFLASWLALSKTNIQDTLCHLAIEATFEEAIGLPASAPLAPPAIDAAPRVPAIEGPKGV